MSFQNQIQNRPRAPRMIWTEEKCLELLNLVQKAVDKTPGGFEKPNVKTFYLQIIQNSEMFQGINYKVVNNKIRAFQTKYNAALIWAQNRHLDLSLAEEQEPEKWLYLNSICKYFIKLQKIFGNYKNLEDEVETVETIVCGPMFSKSPEPFKRVEGRNFDFGIKNTGNISNKFNECPNELEKFKWEKELETKKTMKAMELQHALSMKKLENEKVLKLYEITLKYQHPK